MGPTQTLPVKRLEHLLTRADHLAVWTHAQGYLMSTVEPRATPRPADGPISLARRASRRQERRGVAPS
jgi:hypothetical protein